MNNENKIITYTDDLDTSDWIDLDALPTSKCENKELGITIYEYNGDDFSHTHLDGAMTDEFVTINHVINYLECNDTDYNSKEDIVIVTNIMAIFNKVAVADEDYVIRPKRPKRLYCAKYDLSVGDTILSDFDGLKTLEKGDRLLKYPLETQGYYSFRLCGGDKFDLWEKDVDGTSRYSPSKRGYLWGKR